VPALGRDGCRLEPRRPATDDQHVARRVGRRVLRLPRVAKAGELALATGLGELHARDGVARVEVADARLVAADAGADVIEPPVGGLRGSSGSQINARVMTHMSAEPAARISSASCGCVIRPATMTGTETARLTFAADGAVYPAAIGDGGTMWSEPASVADVPRTIET